MLYKITFLIFILISNLNARSIEEIKESGDIIIAIYENFPPYSYIEDGIAKGIDIDLGKEIAKSMSVKPTWYWTGSDETLDDDLRNVIWKGHIIHKTKADVMLRIPYDYEFIREKDKSTGELTNELVVMKAPYHAESWVIATNRDKIPEINTLGVFMYNKIGVELDTLPDAHLTSSFMGKLRNNVIHYPSILTAIEDLKSGDKIDETFAVSGQLDESRYIKFQETTISEFENLSVEDLVKKHGIKNIKNVDGLLDIIEGVDLSKNLLETTLIHPYINYNWKGKVFKNSIFFNNPFIENKILIKCASNLEMLYFTAIMNQDKKNYLLLSGNFINKKRVTGKKPMNRQEMLVLEDFNEYIVFSNKPKDIKKLPSRYFLISSDTKFLYEMNFRETNTPKDFTKNLNSKMIRSKFLCKRIL